MSGYPFGVLFLVGAGLLVVGALREGSAIGAGGAPLARTIMGGATIAFALLGYPLVGLAFGHTYPEAPLFGVFPCPTAIFTLGVFLFCARPRVCELIVPLVWCFFATVRAINMGIGQDFGATAAAALTIAGLVMVRAERRQEWQGARRRESGRPPAPPRGWRPLTGGRDSEQATGPATIAKRRVGSGRVGYMSGPPDHVLLPDGRRLDIRVTGPTDGLPLLFHVGTPDAATQSRALERAAHARGLRVITSSRAGYGDSTRQPGRRIVDVVADMETVLAALGAEHCLVGGVSGGGPHGLACAARLDAAVAVLVIASVAPYGAEGLDWTAGMGAENVNEFGAALQGEERLRPYLMTMREELKDATVADIISSLETVLPDVDKAVLTDEFGEDAVASFHEALRTGVDGWLDDDLAFTKPWGFALSEISVPTMIWHGTADLMVPFAHGQWLASRLPHASVHLEQGEGHLSLALGALDRMLDELLSAATES